MRVEFGDAAEAADPTDAHTISRFFPHTYGQPLAHFLRATAKVPDAQIITEHPAIRCALDYYLCIPFKYLLHMLCYDENLLKSRHSEDDLPKWIASLLFFTTATIGFLIILIIKVTGCLL